LDENGTAGVSAPLKGGKSQPCARPGFQTERRISQAECVSYSKGYAMPGRG
jgi:hypothetical protein